jgi:CBS-domain-containing membrane protein
MAPTVVLLAVKQSIHQTTDDASEVPHRSLKEILVASGGVCLAILCVGWLAASSSTVLVLGSFGSSCVLLFGYPHAAFSQPRNFMAGHFLSSLIGLIFLHVVGPQWWAMALATGMATAAMMVTRTLHPPAGSNPVIVYLLHSDWMFLWFPTLAGAAVVQVVAVLFHNYVGKTKYPSRWVAPSAGRQAQPSAERLHRFPPVGQRYPNS